MADTHQPCTSPEARQFDFWVGEWDLSWPAEQAGGREGDRQTGYNRINELFGDCVIEENFTTDDASFRGHSVSVYDEAGGVWRQTWVDSAGGYLSFTGGMESGDMILSTDPTEENGQISINRMVFSEIAADSLEWAWQKTIDGGQSWADVWNISYRRRR